MKKKSQKRIIKRASYEGKVGTGGRHPAQVSSRPTSAAVQHLILRIKRREVHAPPLLPSARQHCRFDQAADTENDAMLELPSAQYEAELTNVKEAGLITCAAAANSHQGAIQMFGPHFLGAAMSLLIIYTVCKGCE